MRLQHSATLGSETSGDLRPSHESLVGSGQTLLLLINDLEVAPDKGETYSHYVLMMTPTHIVEVEASYDPGNAAAFRAQP